MTLSLPPQSGRTGGKHLARALVRAGVLALAWTCISGCGGGHTGAAPLAAPGDPAHPTIVSLNPCTDAILAEVTGPGQLLAISGYSHDAQSTSMDLAKARGYRAVSGTVEEVAAIGPKVVVASSFLPPATASALDELGFKVVKMPIAPDLEAARGQIRELAGLTGHPELGKRLIGRIDEALARAAPPRGATPVPALVWESAGLVAGDDTLIVDMMKHTGFTNAASARGLSQADFLPLEKVLADPPRVVFAVGNPLAEEDRMLHHPALASLSRMKRFPLDRSILWCGGPTIPRAIDALGRARRELDRQDAAIRTARVR
ncbi:ABC transporter substrate-binding protein [Novosphingobium sp. PP1Y]|uniref:ABC transporter substrate-binding protein n=1 Tax=Novosphingobium sp. PP1Y TaxID=702113 RepID=UPI00020EECB0|nr:ABC transporter substrate-binding protein [Novosphingobium sp. PP1Y]CCA92617.1 iron complex transport system substrate-binding protein [Novosphingobium sp. PP1Y]